jgi:hypothetical protein
MLGYAALAPVGLANQVLQIVTGESIRGGGHLLHYLAGIIAYPLGWMLVVEPLRRKLCRACTGPSRQPPMASLCGCSHFTSWRI